MHRTTGKNTVIDSAGRRLFSDGPPGSTLPAKWLQAVQEEICNVIEAAGITLDVSQQDQLYQAILSLIPSASFPWYNTRSYGAVPSSVTSGLSLSNSQAEIQACIDAVCLSQYGHALMIMDPGNYRVSSSLTIGGTDGEEDADKCKNTRGFQLDGYNAGIYCYVSGLPAIYFFAGPTDDNLEYRKAGTYSEGDWVVGGSDCPVMMYEIRNLYMWGANLCSCGFQTNHEGMEYLSDPTEELQRQIKYGGKFENIVMSSSVTGGVPPFPHYVIVSQSAVSGSW